MKKKIFSIFFALVLVLSFSLIPAVPVAAASTVILDGNIAALVNAQGSNAEQYIGSGSWASIPNTKMQLYIDPTSPPFDSLGSFTIAEIRNISYVTKNSGTTANVDFGLNIYTVPSGEDTGWYGHRLSAEPLYSYNYTPIIDAWNTWSTDSGDNQLQFYDSGANMSPPTKAGFYTGPTLTELRAGSIDWSTYSNSGSTDTIDYSNQVVKYIVFVTSTGGNWEEFDGYIDRIFIDLSDGRSLIIDLEGLVIEVEIDIKPGNNPNSINLKSKGLIPVAVLTTDDFDASTVDPETVLFAGASPVRSTLDDVDGDGDLDMLFHFKTQDLEELDEDSTDATLTGQTTGGIPIAGTDSVNIVPKKGK